MANPRTALIRISEIEDAPQISRLLRLGAYTHLHSDWSLPTDWLGDGGFVVCEIPGTTRPSRLSACLAVAADPPPAAWIRVAAILERQKKPDLLARMLEEVKPHLRDQGVTQLAWLMARSWPEGWLHSIGFSLINRIITFEKTDLETPEYSQCDILIRSALVSEMETLAEIEATAFDPLWRHSPGGLERAYHQALSFDLAIIGEKPAGFQYSVRGNQAGSAHLVRIAVDPMMQGRGIGSCLLSRAFDHYRKIGVNCVSLNTQADNFSSQRLYRRFGFTQSAFEVPVWLLGLGEA